MQHENSNLETQLKEHQQCFLEMKKLFLNHFHYLNKKGERGGWGFMTLYKTSPVTQKLIELCKAMRAEIDSCDNQILFFYIIKDALDAAWAIRWNYAARHSYYSIIEEWKDNKSFLKNETLYNIKEDGKGRFEEKMIEALSVIQNKYAYFLGQSVGEMITKIDDHHPKKVYGGTSQAIELAKMPSRFAQISAELFPALKEAVVPGKGI